MGPQYLMLLLSLVSDTDGSAASWSCSGEEADCGDTRQDRRKRTNLRCQIERFRSKCPEHPPNSLPCPVRPAHPTSRDGAHGMGPGPGAQTKLMLQGMLSTPCGKGT